MTTTAVRVVKNNKLLADKCVIADTYWVRLKGLMGRKTLVAGEGMLFPRCNSIHMWFMRTALDIVFVGKDGRVSALHPNTRAWRALPLLDLRADSVIELPVGVIESVGLREGDELCFA